MAGRVVVSTLNNDTGVLATQNGMTGIPKAWVNFEGSAATIRGSFNVSSITRNSTGYYTVNFTTAMANTNYAVSGGVSPPYTARYTIGLQLFTVPATIVEIAPTTSSFNCLAVDGANSVYDPKYVNIAVFSS